MYTLRTSTLIIGPAASGKTKTIELIKKNNPNINFAHKTANEIDTKDDKEYENIDCIIIENNMDLDIILTNLLFFQRLNKKCIFEYSYPMDLMPNYFSSCFSQVIILSRKY